VTLNVLLSFAQFEREVTGERIRDKIAASKKKDRSSNVPMGSALQPFATRRASNRRIMCQRRWRS
jgi:DNA invertase Pin-like site-specific DNA recombinase